MNKEYVIEHAVVMQVRVIASDDKEAIYKACEIMPKIEIGENDNLLARYTEPVIIEDNSND